jgi:hypothetical protein
MDKITFYVKVRKHTEDEPMDSVDFFPCETKAQAIELKNAIKTKYLSENPTVNSDNENDTRHILNDTDTSFTVTDDYCIDDLYVDVIEKDLSSTEKILSYMDEEGYFC